MCLACRIHEEILICTRVFNHNLRGLIVKNKFNVHHSYGEKHFVPSKHDTNENLFVFFTCRKENVFIVLSVFSRQGSPSKSGVAAVQSKTNVKIPPPQSVFSDSDYASAMQSLWAAPKSPAH